MSKSRIPTWVSLILLGVGLLAVGIPGLFVYMRVTATKLHHDSQEIPSVMESPPLTKWAGAAEQAVQHSARRYHSLVVASSQIIWTADGGVSDPSRARRRPGSPLR